MSPTARAAYFATESAAVQTPYLMLGVVVTLLALVIKFTPFTSLTDPSSDPTIDRSRWRLLFARREFLGAVIAQFFYIGAQVGIWSYLIRYAQGTIPGTPERSAADFLLLSLVLFMIGRFAGAALMRVIAPVKLLAAYALVSAALTVVAIYVPGRVGLYALVATSFFMSVMFPTIFALGIRGLGEERKVASSVLVMAIVGGAVLTPVMGAVGGIGGIQWSMLIPLLGFVVVTCFAMNSGSRIDPG
jgi:FHS family L-fucose permease-like MFS transporter